MGKCLFCLQTMYINDTISFFLLREKTYSEHHWLIMRGCKDLCIDYRWYKTKLPLNRTTKWSFYCCFRPLSILSQLTHTYSQLQSWGLLWELLRKRHKSSRTGNQSITEQIAPQQSRVASLVFKDCGGSHAGSQTGRRCTHKWTQNLLLWRQTAASQSPPGKRFSTLNDRAFRWAWYDF